MKTWAEWKMHFKVNGTVKILVNDPGVGSTALLLGAAVDTK